MSELTEGPWYYKPVHGEPNKGMLVLNDGKGGWVAVIQHNGEYFEAEQKATGKAIAALPELVEALQRCLQYIEADETAHGRQFGEGNEARAALKQAGVEDE